MEKEKQVAVYFVNGKRAVFSESELVIIGGDVPPRGKDLSRPVLSGKTVVNWQNVCFTRPYREEDDE